MSNSTVAMVELSSDEEADCNSLHHNIPNSLVHSSNYDDDDCVVLDNDPNEQLLHNHNNIINNINSGDGNDDSDDLVVVSEKGQVACRDYPHSRHLCIKFPFSTSPNQSHCEQCYCYVCDSLAPCVYWGNGTAATDHCHATDKVEFWILERKKVKYGSIIAQPVTQPTPPPVHIPNPGLIHALRNLANPQHPRNPFTSRNKTHPDSTSQALIRTHQKFNLDSTVNKPVFKRAGVVRVAAPSAVRVAPADAVNVAPTGAVRVARRDAARAAPQTNATRSARTVAVARAVAASVAQTEAVTDTPTANQNPIRGSFGDANRSLGTVQPNASVNHQQPEVSNHPNFNLFQGATHYQPAPPLPSIPQLVPPQPSYHAPGKTVSDLTRNEAQNSKDGGTGEGSTDNSSLAGGLAGHQYHWFFDGPPIDPGFGDYSLFDSGFMETGPIFDFFDS